LISFSEMGRTRGLTVTSRVLRCTAREARLSEAEELGVAPGSPVCDLARIRCFDGLPIASTEAVVPRYLAPGLEALDFSRRSLYDTLRTQYRVLPARSTFAIQAAACEVTDAQHLEIKRGEPVLIFTQTGFDQLGRAFELARTVYRADRYLFRGTLLAAGERGAPLVQEAASPPS
jgi:DNA-binding GntR family transcriptional regulator